MKANATVLLNRLLARGKFRHLQVLLKIAELGSVQRAADAVGMTQSGVTQTLAYLERLLELPLFERHARGVRMTAVCSDLLPVARQLLQGLTEGTELLVSRRDRGTGVVRLQASIAALHGLLLHWLPAFEASHPGIQVLLSEAEGDDKLLAIGRQQTDLIACREPLDVPQGWRFEPLVDDRYAVLCNAAHPLARRRAVRMDELAGQRWLQAPAGTAVREQFDQFAQAFAGPVQTHMLVTRSSTMIWWLLRNEALLAYLPRSFAQPLLEIGDVREIRVGTPLPLRPLGLLGPAEQPHPAAAQLAQHLRAHYAAAAPAPKAATRPPRARTRASKAA